MLKPCMKGCDKPDQLQHHANFGSWPNLELYVMAQVREGQWTPVNAILAAAVAEVDSVGASGYLVVNFAIGSISQRTYHGLSFHR